MATDVSPSAALVRGENEDAASEAVGADVGGIGLGPGCVVVEGGSGIDGGAKGDNGEVGGQFGSSECVVMRRGGTVQGSAACPERTMRTTSTTALKMRRIGTSLWMRR
jgi:hypothetical protein